MKVYDHDELHKLVADNPQLKLRSDEIHSLPPDTDWDEFERRKCLMIDIWADAVGCQKRHLAIVGSGRVINYFSTHSSSLSDLRRSPNFREHINESKKIENELARNKRCHVAGGDKYVCFCQAVN